MGVILRGLTLLLLLGGCYFSAPSNLHSELTSYSPGQFFRGIDTAFRAENGDHVLVQFDKAKVTLTRTRMSVTGTDYTRTIRQIVRDPSMATGLYMAVYPSGEKYGYFPFLYADDGMGLMFPPNIVDVTSYPQLRSEILTAYPKRVFYRQLDSSASSAAFRRHAAVKADRAQKAREKKALEGQEQKPAAPKPSAPPSGIARLDVGDGVYVQGLFSDELAVVVRIDHQSGQVKVRRSTDSTTAWVHHSKLITREQATANDVGRVGVGVALAFCLFNPDQCKSKK